MEHDYEWVGGRCKGDAECLGHPVQGFQAPSMPGNKVALVAEVTIPATYPALSMCLAGVGPTNIRSTIDMDTNHLKDMYCSTHTWQ